MGTRLKKNSPAARKLRVTLIYPPAENRNSEAFPLPNPAIAALARYLNNSGHEAVQKDLDLLWFSGLKEELSPALLKLLRDRRAARRYAAGKSAPAEEKKLSAAADLFIARAGIARSDLYCFTFADMGADPLMINVSAVLAARLKALYGAPVAVGYRSIPREAYLELMKDYPCFDYASYAEWGEKALAGIVSDVNGGPDPLLDTLYRCGAKLRSGRDGSLPPRAPSPLYDRELLAAYRVTDKRILESYNSDFPFLGELLKKPQEYLAVSYSMQLSCPGGCAFCPNDNSKPSDAKSLDQVMDELCELKELGVTGVYFMNSAFNNNYKRADELCDRMIKHKLNLLWTDCANLWAIDERLIDKMRAAGAVKLTYGMETGSPRLLRYIRKATTIEKIQRWLDYSHRAGIWNHIELIGGLPTETEEDTQATVDFIGRNKDIIDTYSLNPFFLYRSSPFFRQAGKFGLKPHAAAGRADYFNPDTQVGSFSERFDEAGGLKWEQKNRQIMRSTGEVAAAIDRASSSKAIDYEHIHLLMCLYSKLGHARKSTIRKLMRVLTMKFKPYNVNSKITGFAYRKHEYRRVLSSKK